MRAGLRARVCPSNKEMAERKKWRSAQTFLKERLRPAFCLNVSSAVRFASRVSSFRLLPLTDFRRAKDADSSLSKKRSLYEIVLELKVGARGKSREVLCLKGK
jgi:hypothetical protein